VELGGLEEEGNGPAFGPADDEYHLFDRDEVRFTIIYIALLVIIHILIIPSTSLGPPPPPQKKKKKKKTSLLLITFECNSYHFKA
jgi:hypothetical protein